MRAIYVTFQRKQQVSVDKCAKRMQLLNLTFFLRQTFYPLHFLALSLALRTCHPVTTTADIALGVVLWRVGGLLSGCDGHEVGRLAGAERGHHPSQVAVLILNQLVC